MSDAGDREMPRLRLEAGDSVEMVGVEPSSDEYDTGIIVGFTFNGVRVHWAKADEVYTENAAELRRINARKAQP